MLPLNLSLNPSYFCNFRCSFCYLTQSQLADKKTLDINTLDSHLKEIAASGYCLEQVDIYGGEAGILPSDYLEQLDSVFLNAGDPHINVITNLSVIHPYFLKEHISLSVSYDFEAREKSDLVFNNILKLDRQISVLMLASPDLLKLDVEYMITKLNLAKNVVSVEIKPYSSNQSNQHKVSNADYEHFIMKWLNAKTEKKFEFENLKLISKALRRESSSFSDNHVYITPNGKFAVLEFDEKNDEYFLELPSFQSYIEWTKFEKSKVISNAKCGNCKYLGHCLTEHYRSEISEEESCGGYRNLLKHYDNDLR